MQVNVGRTEQRVRGIVGPVLLAAGYLWMGGRKGRPSGLLAMLGGALIAETAITRTCPLNALFGIDTASRERASRSQPVHVLDEAEATRDMPLAPGA